MKKMAPIVLFVYNRMEHTKRTIEALKKNSIAKESDLIVFSDGPKKGQAKTINQLRKYLKTIEGFKTVKIIERKKNMGLANSIITGVSQVIDEYGKVIVLEDDLVSSPNLLEYLNYALEKYQSNDQVFSISGYSHFEDRKKEEIPDTYFLKIISSWAWATWKNRWQIFDKKARNYRILEKDLQLRKLFNYDNTIDYYGMIRLQMKEQYSINSLLKYRKKKIDSWAIRWYWSVFQQEGLTLYPRNTLAVQIGHDGSGTHCGCTREYQDMQNSIDKMYCDMMDDIIYEDVIEEKEYIRELVKSAIKSR